MIKEVDDCRRFTSPAELHKAINTLKGIVGGITADGKVSQPETEELVNWCNLHRHLADRHPFKEIISTIDLALKDDDITSEEVQDIIWLCNNLIVSSKFYDAVTSAIQQLEGLLHGLLSDNQLSDQEIRLLDLWVAENDFLKYTYPYDEIRSLLRSVLSDGLISDDERLMLKSFLSLFVDTTVSVNLNYVELEELRKEYNISGVCSIDPEILVKGNTFCFTGKSFKSTRNEIAETVNNLGGIFNDRIVSSTKYLIIGNGGSPCWAFACYGRKVEEAVHMRKNGSDIILVYEDDFWKVMPKP